MTADEQRIANSLAGKIGAHTRWATVTDRAAALEPAREGFLAKLEKQVDPDGVMPSHERAAAVDRLHKAHMARMTLLSRQARARRKQSGSAA